MEYIEREKALNADFKIQVDMFESRRRTAEKAVQTYANYIASIHAADVRPAKRGWWIEWWPGDCTKIMTGEELLWMCSECAAKYSERHKFCSNCGAEMEDGNASD